MENRVEAMQAQMNNIAPMLRVSWVLTRLGLDDDLVCYASEPFSRSRLGLGLQSQVAHIAVKQSVKLSKPT